MTITTKPLRKIAEEYPSAVTVFERFEIDLCTWGDKDLAETCAGLQLSAEQILEKLEKNCFPGGAERDVTTLSLTQLIQRIVRTHHRRIRQDLPALARMADKLAGRHPGQSVSFARIAKNVDVLHSKLLAHIEKEEQILFPFIAQLEEETGGLSPTGRSHFASVKQPIARMMQEHATAVETVDVLRQCTSAYQPAEEACPTQRALYGGLKNFEADLQQHLYLEEHVLFPRVIGLEMERLQGRSA